MEGDKIPKMTRDDVMKIMNESWYEYTNLVSYLNHAHFFKHQNGFKVLNFDFYVIKIIDCLFIISYIQDKDYS